MLCWFRQSMIRFLSMQNLNDSFPWRTFWNSDRIRFQNFFCCSTKLDVCLTKNLSCCSRLFTFWCFSDKCEMWYAIEVLFIERKINRLVMNSLLYTYSNLRINQILDYKAWYTVFPISAWLHRYLSQDCEWARSQNYVLYRPSLC